MIEYVRAEVMALEPDRLLLLYLEVKTCCTVAMTGDEQILIDGHKSV